MYPSADSAGALSVFEHGMAPRLLQPEYDGLLPELSDDSWGFFFVLCYFEEPEPPRSRLYENRARVYPSRHVGFE